MVRIRISRTPRVDVVTRKNLALAHPVGQNPHDHLPWSKTGVLACHFCNPKKPLESVPFFSFLSKQTSSSNLRQIFPRNPKTHHQSQRGRHTERTTPPPIALKDPNCANSLLENTQFFCTSVCATNFSCFALISAVAFPRLHASMQHPRSRNHNAGCAPSARGSGKHQVGRTVGRVFWFEYILRVRVYGAPKIDSNKGWFFFFF